MKKTAIILAALTIFSCNKEESLPEPQAGQTQTQTTINPIVEENKLEGQYICNEWDLGRGNIDKMEIFLYDRDEYRISVLINYYPLEKIELLTSSAPYDSNYFDTGVTFVSQSFRGSLVNDSTLRVTVYAYDFVGQTKDFIRQ